MILIACALAVLLGKTLVAKQQILSVFLEIPEKTAKYLYQKCENFLSELGSGEEDEVHSEIEIFIDEKENYEEGKTSVFGKQRKKFKNTESNNLSFLFKMFGISLCVEVYFIFNHLFGTFSLLNILLLKYIY